MRRRIFQGIGLVIGVWGFFLIFFSMFYPIATKVQYAADQKIESNHAIYTSIEKIPMHLQNAIISTEDRRFYEHFGIDPLGVARSLFIDIESDRYSEGGSTITQQLIRNTVLTTEKTIRRKLEEALFAVALERYMSKQKILELYLNVIYYGHGAYGAEKAAQIYFGKPLGSLNLAESAMIAGLPNAPTELDPYLYMDRAKERQKEVLDNMLDTHQITQQEETEAYNTPIHLADNH